MSILNLTLILSLKLVRVSTPRAPLLELSVRTRKHHAHELQMTRSILSAGAEDADKTRQLQFSRALQDNDPRSSLVRLPWFVERNPPGPQRQLPSNVPLSLTWP